MAKQFLFSADDGTHGQELWISNGTPAGTHLLKDIDTDGGSSPYEISPLGDGRALFAADDGVHGDELWVTDGTSAGTALLKELTPGSNGTRFISDFTPLGGGTFAFSTRDNTDGVQLWTTDGTAAGTVAIKLLHFGSIRHPSLELTPMGNGRALFYAYDDTNGRELWLTDGTAAGTTLLKDINPGPDGSLATAGFTPLGDGRFLFGAADQSHGAELWVTDGTTSGTRLVKDIDGGPGDSFPQSFTALGNGRFIFEADDGVHGTELWTTDGTAGGTQLVKDISDGATSGGPRNFTSIGGGRFVFTATDTKTGTGGQVWVTNGTAAGTVLVKTLIPGATTNVRSDYDFASLGNGQAVFKAETGASGYELWVTDGTAGDTHIVKDINAGQGSSSPYNFVPLGDGRLAFNASDNAHFIELWVTDGTEAGTTVLKDINPGSGPSFPSTLVPIDAAAGSTAPSAIALSSKTVAEFARTGTTVGTLSAIDADAGDTFTFKLLDSAGGRFALSGNTLKVANGLLFDYEQARSDTVKVQVTDGEGHSLGKTLALTVKDVNPEKLTGSARAETFIGGAKNDKLSGAAGNDTLTGGSGNDLLDGGLGKDVLKGGAGKDTFFFSTKPTSSNLDHIKDFRAADDTIQLKKSGAFIALDKGHLDRDALAMVKSGKEVVGDDVHILYDKAHGALYYDPNGGSVSGRIEIAVLDNHASLTFKDFLIV